VTGIHFASVFGPGIRDRIDAVSALRVAVFRDFPYLYDGTPESERSYLETLLQAPASAVFLAIDGEQIVGASTALLLSGEPPEVRAPFEASGYAPERVMYFGESVLLAPYRGQGIGVRFFELRLAHARATPGVTHAAFCAVRRPTDHPRRPEGYVPLDAFWLRRGFAPAPGMSVEFFWKDIDEDAESAKIMDFWTRALDAE
jgi:GNAT superfamily N-acetyltransferase